MCQDSQYRPAGRTLRFTVVTHADMHLAAGRSCNVCPAVMGGICELRAHLLHELLRIRPGGTVRYARYEPAALDLLLDAVQSSRYEIPGASRRHAQILALVAPNKFWGTDYADTCRFTDFQNRRE